MNTEHKRRWKKCVLIFVPLLLFSKSVSIPADTFLDNFGVTWASQQYSRQDGDVNWASDWVESDNSLVWSGDVSMLLGELLLQDDNVSITRNVNLAGYTSLTLSFDYSEDSLDNSDEWVDIEIRTGGGAWVQLQRFEGPTNESGVATIDISAYAASDAQLRFRTSTNSSMSNFDGISIDNFKIVATVGTSSDDCSFSFDGALQNNTASGTITLGNTNVNISNPDNVLSSGNPIIGGNNSCNGDSCSHSGTPAAASNVSVKTGSGSDRLEVANGASIIVDSALGNDFNYVWIGTGSTVTFAGDDSEYFFPGFLTIPTNTVISHSSGDYWYNGFSGYSNGSSFIVNDGGTVRVFVNGQINIDGDINIDNGGVVFFYATGHIQVGSNVTVNAYLYTENSFILGDGSTVNGGISAATLLQVNNNSTVNYIPIDNSGGDFGAFCEAGSVLVSYHFDESNWAGDAGEVLDASTNNHHATAQNGADTDSATPAIAGDIGTCGYGDFDGSDDYIALPSSLPDLSGSFTLTGWIRARTLGGEQRIFADDETNVNGFTVSLGDPGSGKLRFSSRAVMPADTDTQDAVITANNWHFFAAVHDSVAKTRYMYVDGSLLKLNDGRSVSVYSGTWQVDSGTESIGGETNTSKSFDGNIDELRIYDDVLGTAKIQALQQETHICYNGPDHFDIDHNSSAIYCAPTLITVTAEDASNVVDAGYVGTITLDTQSGFGDWSLSTGSGTLNNGTANDGIATYLFDNSDAGVAVFSLDHSDTDTTTALDINILVQDGLIVDDDLEGPLSYSASGFTITGNALVNTGGVINVNLPIDTQIAGSSFDTHLAAFGQTPTDASCGIIESYQGDKTLTFSTGYVDPTTGTLAFIINNDSATPLVETVTFDAGQATVPVKYKDVGRINISATDGFLVGTSNNFVVKPDEFKISLSGDPNATGPDGPIYKKSGEDFTVTVSVVDAEDDVTPNYGNEVAPESIRLTHNLQSPSGGEEGNLMGSLTGSDGVFSGDFQWNEVGIITLTADVLDGDYLGAGGINTPSSKNNIGRFIPDHFEIGSTSLVNRTDSNTQSGCSANFTFLDEALSLHFDIKAMNVFSDVTKNYVGDFSKLQSNLLIGGNSSDIKNSFNVIARHNGLDYRGNEDLEVDYSNPPFFIDGIATGVPVKVTVKREESGIAAEPYTPVLPLNDTVFSVKPIDDDNVESNSHVDVGTTTLYFGRLVVENAYGSELKPLPIWSHTEYCSAVLGGACTQWESLTPSNDVRDTCTQIDKNFSDVDIELTTPKSYWDGGSDYVNIGPVKFHPYSYDKRRGGGSWQLNYTGGGDGGSYIVPSLGLDTLYDYHPYLILQQGTANFGSYRGHDSIIYWREVGRD